MAQETPALQPDTKARRALVKWMGEAPKERGQTAIARELRLRQQSVRQWIVRISRPGDAHREALELLTGGLVKAAEWETGRERQTRERMLDRLRTASP